RASRRAADTSTTPVAPITIAPPRTTSGVTGSPRTTHASTTVTTGEHCVIMADRHDSTWRCDQITSVWPTKPGTSATPQIATQSRADGHAGTPPVSSAAGVITIAAALITQPP